MKYSVIQILEANGKLHEADMQITMTLVDSEVVQTGSLLSQETQHKMITIVILGIGARGTASIRVSLILRLGKDGLIRKQC